MREAIEGENGHTKDELNYQLKRSPTGIFLRTESLHCARTGIITNCSSDDFRQHQVTNFAGSRSHEFRRKWRASASGFRYIGASVLRCSSGRCFVPFGRGWCPSFYRRVLISALCDSERCSCDRGEGPVLAEDVLDAGDFLEGSDGLDND
jgi:hypothetical protein